MLFFPLFLVMYFSHRRTVQIKTIFGLTKNLGVDRFLDPLSHIKNPWRPIWISRWCGVEVTPGTRRLVFSQLYVRKLAKMMLLLKIYIW